jgi:hypothetical protein
MTSGAGATGPTTGTTTTGMTGMQEQGGQQTQSASYGRGTAPAADYRTAGRGHRATTGSMVGGVLAVVAGLLSFLAGLGVVVRPRFYPTINGYAYAWNGRGWGWILLILGVVLFAAGASALLGIPAARPVAIGLAVLTAIAGFLWLVYTPVLGIIIVALAVFAIWGLVRDGAEQQEPM